MCGVTLKDRIRNCVIREKCRMKVYVLTKIGERMLRRFGHREMIDAGRLMNEIYEPKVNGTVRRERPYRTYAEQIEIS